MSWWDWERVALWVSAPGEEGRDVTRSEQAFWLGMGIVLFLVGWLFVTELLGSVFPFGS